MHLTKEEIEKLLSQGKFLTISGWNFTYFLHEGKLLLFHPNKWSNVDIKRHITYHIEESTGIQNFVHDDINFSSEATIELINKELSKHLLESI